MGSLNQSEDVGDDVCQNVLILPALEEHIYTIILAHGFGESGEQW